ncbi:SRPBCC family protein [Actinomadura parmotrematis]|uniref:SRPBCC family protein n=1 Tax=Actinomadura parmotrematis TaxID=2864039 RepID=A0ABS7G3C0_9ACTN|nr:SRPBCC family protein [Actinomadura parmotrematis]MBW8487172.1 SRPBCC family protein [Actinomadura parmotrematis]
MVETVRQLGAVTRRVGERALESGRARTVVLGQRFPGSPADVWAVLTDPARLPCWFLPVTGELRPGGRFEIEGNAAGVVEHCDPPRAFAVTWEARGQASRVEVRLAPDAGGTTRLELEHALPDDEHWARYGPGAVGVGWEMALLGLAVYLAGGRATTPRARAAWAVSHEARAFMAVGCERWREAAVAAGEDEAAARAAADNTRAAYTG